LCLTSATCRYEEYFYVVFADILISIVGSPFVCKVLDASQVLISGSALKMSPLGRTAVVIVDPQMSAGDLGTCDVTVTSPSGQTIPVRLTKTEKFTAEFMPTEVGEF
jgi:filamin